MIRIVLLCLFAVLAFAQTASAQNVQSWATDPNSYYHDALQLHQMERQKFPAFIDSYHNSVKYGPTTDYAQPTDGSDRSKQTLGSAQQMKQKALPDSNPTRVAATGFILPSGFYFWDGRFGFVPNPTLAMPGFTTPFSVSDGGYVGPQKSMLDAVDPTHSLRTTSITNAEFAMIQGAASELRNELRSEPDRYKDAMRAGQEAKQSSQSSTTGAAAQENITFGWQDSTDALINIANEDAWVPCGSHDPWKTYQQAAWMMGQMYKQCYIPMAILLLLPGAVLTQVKIIVRTGFLPDTTGADEDLVSPFTGILRSLIAVFLIPATQLFVSYSIDVGNSLTYEVINCRYWDLEIVYDWAYEQAYNPSRQNDANHLQRLGARTQGKAPNMFDWNVTFEQQSYMSSTGQQWYNTLIAFLGQGLLCLNAFQLVMMMYLLLLGPIAAALYAWPSVSGDVFKKVYSNWMDGVVLVCLWKFWWCVVLLCMSVRLQAMQQLGNGTPPESLFEMFMCAAFTSILMYVPFNPFDFRPGDLVQQVLQQAQEATAKGGSAAAVSGTANGSNPGTSSSAQGDKIA